MDDITEEIKIENLMERPAVMKKFGIGSNPTLPRWIKTNRIPKGINYPPGTDRKMWIVSEVNEAFNKLMAASLEERGSA